MNGIFKRLDKPEQEQTDNSVFKGEWFVFIDDSQPYTGDDLHFLHNDGTRLCSLKDGDVNNSHIMFDTECEAFTKSLNYYILHSKELEYPWWDEFTEAQQREQSGTYGESQVMEFE